MKVVVMMRMTTWMLMVTISNQVLTTSNQVVIVTSDAVHANHQKLQKPLLSMFLQMLLIWLPIHVIIVMS